MITSITPYVVRIAMARLGKNDYIVRGGYTAGALETAYGKHLLKPTLTSGGNGEPNYHSVIRLTEQFPRLDIWLGETVPDGKPVLIFPGTANKPTILCVEL
jgi:hypothetical protein